MRTKIYDPEKHRLMYFEEEASEEFWTEKWKKLASHTFLNPPRQRRIIRTTRRYLPVGSRILEGGCGLGQVVYALDKVGFKTHGIDFSSQVVEAVNKNWPHLAVTCGDVRNLQVQDGAYDGYWSFGVIEHFIDGYDDIAQEMKRVLREGGYLFLTFPSFNQFRQTRAAAGSYLSLDDHDSDFSKFYQFALNAQDLIKYFKSLGFELLKHGGNSSLHGLAEDSQFFSFIESFLEKFPARVGTAISAAMDIIIGRYAGHSCLLVLRKKEQ